MDHPETHMVTLRNGVAPAGQPDECFWCRAAVGDPHKADCVCRKRTVVLRYSYEVVVPVPEDSTEEQILFHRNDGSWCADNSIAEIGRRKEDACWCSAFEAAYVREATANDEELFENLIHEE